MLIALINSAPLGGIIVEEYGPRASFLCVSAAAIFALGCYLFLPETRGLSQENPITSTDKVDNEESSGPTTVTMQAPLVDWPELLSMNQWRGLALCQCGASIGFAAKVSSRHSSPHVWSQSERKFLSCNAAPYVSSLLRLPAFLFLLQPHYQVVPRERVS